VTEPGEPTESATTTERTCPWCSERARPEDKSCRACGAALAQREDLGGVVIPGVTGIDPGLAAYDAQPVHLRGPSPTQGLATGILPAAALGGPAGLAILGGIAAVAAVEYASGRGPGGAHVDPATVGELGGVAKLALEKLEREAEQPSTDPAATTPGPIDAADAGGESA
jgi:hypothetical protein